LKVSAKIFDPLGFLSPIIIGAKLLFQQVCISKVEWDQSLEGETLSKWNQLLREFELLRMCYEGCSVEISFVASKTRVAPLKKQSIPQLELMGATLLARLLDNTAANAR